MQATLIEAHDIAEGVRHFVFEAPELAALQFQPGQWVSLTGVLHGKEITRAYSIASAPSPGHRFELCLNLVDHGAFSPHLFDLKPGDRVEMGSPMGTFTLREPPRDSLMIATGTGIAPFRSILEARMNELFPPVTLLFGVRDESHIFYRDEFESMERRYPQFHFWPTLTRPDAAWPGRTGRVQAHLEEAMGGRRELDIYLCGLKEMVDDLRAILKSMGFDRKQIRYEKYD